MRLATSIVAAAAFIVVSGSARAEASLIPSNYVDDFGSLAPSAQTGAAPAGSTNAHVSSIPSNYVDDFGDDFPAAPGAPREETATARAQPAVPNSDSSGS